MVIHCRYTRVWLGADIPLRQILGVFLGCMEVVKRLRCLHTAVGSVPPHLFLFSFILTINDCIYEIFFSKNLALINLIS